MLLHSELAPGGTHVGIDPQDWRWIAPLLAFDLRLQPGKVGTRLPRVPHLGDLEVRGEATAIDAEQLRLVLELRVIDNRDDGHAGSGTGKLDLTRTVQDGVVTAFAGQLVLEMQFGPRLSSRDLHGTFAQDWHLDRVVEHREPGFTAAVAEAIVRGAEPIHHALRPDRPEFATRPAGADHPCGEGRLALGIQTLLTAGMPGDDPVIVAALAELRRRRIVETYSLATSILALDALYAPAGERDALRSGALSDPVARQPEEADARLLAEWTARLRDNRDSGSGTKVARWTYLGGPQFDNSNSQYALLGLWQAQWCGQPTATALWQAAANHWIAAQHRADGPARALRCVDAPTFAAQGLQAATRGGSAGTAAPRGFGYKAANAGPAYGSMTAAGVTGLGLCREMLTADGGKAPAKLDNALRAGLAWLSRERSVRWNPGPVTQRHEFFFYWLYSLERACQLNHVALLDDWDWYHDGAQVLLALQDDDGAFGPATFEQQCFAVLFLGRAQLAARTGAFTDKR
ncbi:MAG: hypothetical protein H6838_18120 [Planctomycetes bacterium]|nr:hypothetical protein [Planctomycetota bacterium]